MVRTYEVNSHSTSCQKYKNEKCRYHFGKFLTERTIISLPSPSDLPEAEKNNILNEREYILSTVKQYIDNNLDPRKYDILNPLKEDFEETPSIKSILTELGVTENMLTMNYQFQVILIFRFISSEHQMHVLSITFSQKDYKYGKQTLIYSQCLIIEKL